MSNNINFKPVISLLLVIVALFTVIIALGKVLVPFIVALILTYIINPLVEKINVKFKIKRSIISLIISLLVFLIFLSIPLFIIPTIILQLKLIITSIPDLINLFNNKILQTINLKYGTNLTMDFGSMKNLLLSNFSKMYNNVNIFSPLAKNSVIILEIIVYIILIPFILFYSIINWHQFIKFFDSLIPKSYITNVHHMFHDIDLMLSAYLRGQISVMLIMAAYYALALHFVGINSGVMIGTLTGFLVFIPYLGIFTGLLISLSVGFADFHGMHQIFAILIAYGIGHVLEGGLVTPFLIGGRIGLNPIMVILALMIFGQLFGLVGILLALPLATITVVLLKHAKFYYIKTQYYNEIN